MTSSGKNSDQQPAAIVESGRAVIDFPSVRAVQAFSSLCSRVLLVSLVDFDGRFHLFL